MALIPDIHSTVARNIGLAELGVRGGMRIAQTFAAVSPRALRWALSRRRPSPVELRELFEALGATYIKFGQFIASSPSLFPREYVEAFEQLLDQTAPIDFATIEGIVEADLGRPLSEVFRHVERAPLASASIAQVHAATLVTGEDVVIKVQKPGVQAVITVDMHTVWVLVRLLEMMLPNTDREALTDIVAEMYQAMIDECDFEKEAQNLQQFSAFVTQAGISSVVAPRAYPQASATRVLTMERFYGCSLTDPEALAARGAEPAAALFEALNIWFASLMGCEVFHADLHSGNMLLLEDGRVGFIDFGMVGRVSPGAWQAVFDLFGAVQEHNYQQAAEAMLAVGMTRATLEPERLASDLEALFKSMDDMTPADSGSEGVNRLVNALGEVARNHGIRFPRSFTLLLKQILYFDRYLQFLDPGAQLFQDERIVMMPGT